MSLMEMSVYGGIVILAVIVLRAMTLNRLPKRTFLALWAVAAARLLLPFPLPSPLSVYTLAKNLLPAEAAPAMPQAALPAAVPAAQAPAAAPVQAEPVPAAASTAAEFPLWQAVWLAGMLLCAAAFLIAYLRCRREFRTALPAEDGRLALWLSQRGLLRPIAIRQSDRIAAPLTYGVFRPVILLPSRTDWGGGQLDWVLEHELVHIQHFDVLAKLVLAAAACVHWFNPLVWCMYVLANRDIELGCDEAVVRRLGVDRRREYAMALITMEERKSGLGPFASAFSKNAIEERITAIMKLKKRSLAAILAAVALICVVTTGFATSADGEGDKDLREYLTVIPNDGFTGEESRLLFSLWIDDYEGMTVMAFREKMRGARTDKDMEIIERFSLSETAYQLSAGKEADALAAFNDYFFNIYEPLTADEWRTRSFDGEADGTFYCYSLTILDENALTVGEYDRIRRETETALRQPMKDAADAFEVEKLGTGALQVEIYYYLTSFRGEEEDPDAALHAASSQQTAAEWDRLLTPYTPFGLTYQFDDPDNDGNGLTMWYGGKEVRGIMDEQEGVWLTERSGITTYAAGAIELYTVYTDGVLTGLREATAEEQAAFTEVRTQNSAWVGLLDAGEEQREFPNATRADYDGILTLKTADYAELSLEEFNQRLLDWANENGGAYDRINCDVIWNDCAVELTEEEWSFVSHTCSFSGTENGQMIRALYTGQEQDPGFAANLPMRDQEIAGISAAWCNLYYDISYHISDKSACTVGERDACVGEMKNAIAAFWQDTDLDVLLAMSEQDMVNQFNTWASRCGTEHVSFHHITGDHIHYECADERPIYDEIHHKEPAYSSGSEHHSSGHHG